MKSENVMNNIVFFKVKARSTRPHRAFQLLTYQLNLSERRLYKKRGATKKSEKCKQIELFIRRFDGNMC